MRAREELVGLLRAHDPEDAEKNRRAITPEHVPLLRQIAGETPVTGTDPGVRRAAIAALADFPASENLNLLTTLARLDGDPYIRAEAVIGLGRTGLTLAVPVVADALASRQSIESVAAERSLEMLVGALGPGAVRLELRGDRRRRVLAVLDRAETPGKPTPRKRGRKPRGTSRDRGRADY